jgi:hypothetical protein
MDLGRFQPNTTLKKVGLGLVVLSAIGGIVTSISVIAESGFTSTAIGQLFAVLIGILFYGGIGAFLILSPLPQAILDKRRKNKSDQAERDIADALKRLEKTSGVRAAMAYENLERIVYKTQKDSVQRLSELLKSIEFDKSLVESKFIGSVANMAGPMFGSADKKSIRIYKDWVIAGQIGFDFDISTRGQVNVDGSITYDKKNNRVDNRTATLQLATQDWSYAFKIHPDHADEARRIVNQLLAIVEEMKPKGVTATDIQEAMSKLVSSGGKSPAEKLEELSNLRYQRLLTDQEFETAKAKILEV